MCVARRPRTRETDVLASTAHVEVVHAVALCGGSAFGLDAAGGVVQYLDERGIGYAVGPWRVPIVPAAVIFDLFVGDGRVRPARAMGYAATAAATTQPPEEGRVGAAAGATVGKLAGHAHHMWGGVGSTSRRHGDLVVGALVVVNAIGSVYDPITRERIAGPHNDDGTFMDDRELLARGTLSIPPGTNTTLAVVATNATLPKALATKVAQMAHDGMARAVDPVHLTRDGDVAYACALGGVEAPVDLVGTLGADAVAEAIARAVRAANRKP